MALTGLIDVISTRHGTPPPRTYLRGPRRIDYILANPNILSSVRKCGHLGIQDGIYSDHVGVWIELDGRKLFQSSTANMGTARVKALNLRDQKQCDRFLQVVDAHMQHQNVDERSAKLQTEMPYGIFATPAQERKYERIAADVDDAMNAGITAVCHTNVGYHRSPALTSAANLVRYWKHQRQARRHDVGLSTRLLQYAQLNGLPQSVLRELDILQHLRESWAALRTVQT